MDAESVWQDPAAPGESVFYRRWTPPEIRCRMLLLHGFAEHGGRYAHYAPLFAAQGFEVVIPDLPGHGRSSGKRGHIPDIDACLQKIERFRYTVMGREGKQVLYGHSFGALLAIRLLQGRVHEFAAGLVESPFLAPGFEVPRWKITMGRCMARLRSEFPVSMGLNAADLSSDSAVVEAYRADPLVHGVMTAATYLAILRAQQEAMGTAGANTTALCLATGGADKVVSRRTAMDWFAALPEPKRHIEVSEGRHELHNEPGYRELASQFMEFAHAQRG